MRLGRRISPIRHHSPPFATVRFELNLALAEGRGRLSASPVFALIRPIGCQMGVKRVDQMFQALRGWPPRAPGQEVRPGPRFRPAILLVLVLARSVTIGTAVWPGTPGLHHFRTTRTCLLR